MHAVQSLRVGSVSPVLRAVNKIAFRFAGGGGRPGARPTFNWKERRALGLDDERITEDVKLRPIMYDEEYVEKHFKASKGGIKVDLLDLNLKEGEEWAEPTLPEINHRKKIDVTKLFGSNKTCGPYISPREKEKGAYKRNGKTYAV